MEYHEGQIVIIIGNSTRHGFSLDERVTICDIDLNSVYVKNEAQINYYVSFGDISPIIVEVEKKIHAIIDGSMYGHEFKFGTKIELLYPVGNCWFATDNNENYWYVEACEFKREESDD